MSVAFVPPLMCSCCAAVSAWRAGQWMPARVKSPRARNVILEICEARNVTTARLFGRTRGTRKEAATRHEIARRLLAEVTNSQSQVARWLGRHPSTINVVVPHG